MQKQLSVGVARLRPDTVIGDQSSTYVLTPGGNPFYVEAGTTIATSAGDGVDGATGAFWRLGNAGTIDGFAAGVDLQSRSTVTNAGAIAGASGSGVVLGNGGGLTNRKGATIEGTDTFVAGSSGGQRAGVSVAGAAGTVINSGITSAPVGPGVQLLAGGQVTNWSGGAIYGAGGVFIAGAAGTITNGGVLLGAAAGAAVLYKGGTIVNWANGAIIGAMGVHIRGGLGQVSNAGDIVGRTSNGVLLTQGGEVTNDKHGTISGQVYGVDITGRSGTVINHGSIAGALFGSTAVKLRGGGTVINASGATIAGTAGVDLQQRGNVTNARGARIAGEVELQRGGDLSNAGTIASAGQPSATAVLDSGSGAVINSGAIIGGISNYAIDISSGARFSNLAGGRVSGEIGVAARSAGAFTNAGKIRGTFEGVYVSDGSFTNLVSGQISAETRSNNYFNVVGVALDKASFENAGSIQSRYRGVRVSADSKLTNDRTGTIVADGTGIYGAGTIVNNGLISVQGNDSRDAISTYGATALITNAGDIEASRVAIDMADGGTLVNKTGATISGEVEIGGGGTLTNEADATISGLVDVSGTVVNAGTVAGGLGATELILKTGAVEADASAQTVVLQGEGEVDLFYAATLYERDSGNWTLTGSSNLGAVTITKGTLQAGDATDPDADVVVGGALVNFATIEVAGGTMEIDGGVFGAGKAIIAGGTLELGSTFNEAVAFTGSSGVLQLAKSQAYTGSISGFSLTGGTSLDLRDIGFTSGTTTASYVDNGSDTGGVLTLTDGTHTAHIELIGDYSGSTFTTSSDGDGGTTVVDPQKTSSPAVLPFVAAMAGFGASGGRFVPTAESGRSAPALLAAAHPIG